MSDVWVVRCDVCSADSLALEDRASARAVAQDLGWVVGFRDLCPPHDPLVQWRPITIPRSRPV